ncbi:MAG TPA: hypothetical protein HA306_01630 [Methanosarcina sp.]|nr:hypothetical protein [Methanosarcina sp.]
MTASWSLSHTLGKQKAFFWRIDSRGNIFIKRKFRKTLFPRIDKLSCSHLDRLHESMQNMGWQDLANNAAKLYVGTEKEGVGKFLYRLRPEVPYAQLSSQLAAIFYYSGVWDWNRQKKGMKFMLLAGEWQENIAQYYRDPLSRKNEGNHAVKFSEKNLEKGQKPEERQEFFKEILQKGPAQKIEQTKLSAFFEP